MRQTALALGCLLALTAGAARAQDPVGLLAADEEMVQRLLKPRSIQELSGEYESAQRRAEAAGKDVTEATEVLSVARARVDVKKGEIALLKTRAKLAKKEKNMDARAGLDKQIEREERGLRVFKAMAGAAEAQKERAEAAAEFARARMKMHEAELDLARQHDERVAQTAAVGGATPDPAAAARLGQMDVRIRKSVRGVLKSLEDYAGKSKRLADTTGDLANARLDLLDAWESYKEP